MFAAMMAAVLAVTGLTGCGSSASEQKTQAQADVPTEPFGDTIKLVNNFGVFEIPTFDGNPYAYNRYNGESTFGVNKNAPADQQAVAQDFVKYFLANDEAQVEFNLAMSTFPAKKSLAANEKILENPSLKVFAEHIDHYIWPGPMPSTVETSLKKAGQDVFFNGVDIDTAFAEAQANIEKDMKNSSFVSVENLYAYAE